ncbi:hypothetical protein [Edaphobacter bradus]|uniref:hypothetical protein n=1 Tax=Edaphobacter bradus TaxID=2259016 RepID=UPI0021DFCCF5|nr:hypothetical protein [Edaphobacter bradus]
MRRRTKIILAVPLVLISLLAVGALDYSVDQRRIKAEEKAIYSAQLPLYSSFLKPGMQRIDVEHELRSRSISFRPNYEYGQYPKDEFILLKRIGSPVWYCSYEDITLQLEFNSSFNPAHPEDDPLTGISEYRVLIDCL